MYHIGENIANGCGRRDSGSASDFREKAVVELFVHGTEGHDVGEQQRDVLF